MAGGIGGVVDFDGSLTGTSEQLWAPIVSQLGPLELPTGPSSAVIVAPHPDDETLGAGGLIADLSHAGWRVDVVVVSDGARSHPGTAGLAAIRAGEVLGAVRALGLTGTVSMLEFPDGRLGELTAPVVDALQPHIDGHRLIVGPWGHDGHPDHEATGAAVRRAMARSEGPNPGERRLLRYPVWAWHWATPSTLDLRSAAAWAVSPRAQAAKRGAIESYRSQRTAAFGPVIVGDHLLPYFLRSHEVFWC